MNKYKIRVNYANFHDLDTVEADNFFIDEIGLHFVVDTEDDFDIVSVYPNGCWVSLFLHEKGVNVN